MPDQAPKQVLIVDDSDDYLDLLVRFMKKTYPDAAVTSFNPVGKGKPGPDFDWSKFDVLIMEYRLGPEENGLDWLREFKNDQSSFPATILLTASGNEDIAVRALRYGAHDYLRKQNLSPKRLAESIADAFNVRTKQSSAALSLTLNASRFSKSFFYGQFSLAFDDVENGGNRAVILIAIDGFDDLRDSFGVLGTDAIARHLGNIGVDVFRIGAYRPRATRFTDSSIAILAGQYESKDHLQRLLNELCARIRSGPPRVDGAPVPVTLSIGAVIIRSPAPGVAGLLEQAEGAVAEANASEGDSIVIQESGVSRVKASAAAQPAEAFDARKAIRENRIQANFQALMKASDSASKLPFSELFQISARFIAHDGKIMTVESVLKQTKDKELPCLIDRWKIRECIGRLSSESPGEGGLPGFCIELSEASCTDASLAGWIGELIKHHGKKRRFGELCLGLQAEVFMRHLKPLLALLAHLNKRHGFLFALSNIEDAKLCAACLGQYPFNLLAVTHGALRSLKDDKSGAGEWANLLGAAKNRGALIVVSGIEDAQALTSAISEGADFVQGDFIAPEQEEVESVVGVESVQIGA